MRQQDRVRGSNGRAGVPILHVDHERIEAATHLVAARHLERRPLEVVHHRSHLRELGIRDRTAFQLPRCDGEPLGQQPTEQFLLRHFQRTDKHVLALLKRLASEIKSQRGLPHAGPACQYDQLTRAEPTQLLVKLERNKASERNKEERNKGNVIKGQD